MWARGASLGPVGRDMIQTGLVIWLGVQGIGMCVCVR